MRHAHARVVEVPLPWALHGRAERTVAPWATLAVLCSSILIVNLDTTVLNVALPTLVKDLGATSSQLQWIVDAYALVFGGLLLVSGSLADRFGRKFTFALGLLAFAAGSAWAAFSGTVTMLITARASMGIGASLLMPSTLSIITDVFRDPARRQRAIGIWAGTSGVGFALGPIIGGALLDHFWWGSVFLINVPIALAACLLAVPFVPNSLNPAALRPDAVGALASVGGLALLLWAVIEAPVDGWTSVSVIGPGAGGLALLCLFAAWERTSSHPMLNLAFFRVRSFSMAVSSVGLVMFGLLGALFMLTQFLQFDLGLTALQSGVRMLPIAAVLAVVAPLSAVANRALGTKLTTGAGMFACALGLWMISRTSVGSGYLDVLPGMMVVGFGAALVMPSVSASVMGSVPQAETGIGSATNGTFIQVGGAVGVAVVGSLLSTRYKDRMTPALAAYHLPAHVLSTALGSVGGALSVAAQLGGRAGALLAGAARSAFVSGTDLGLLPAAAVVLAGCIVVFMALPSRPGPARGLPPGRTAPSDRPGQANHPDKADKADQPERATPQAGQVGGD